jgi:serine/threonine protein kinase
MAIIHPESRSQFAVALPLSEPFRFTHEPIPVHSNQPLIDRDRELSALTDRIFYSDGGSFLVTGYRGVGKTTFVNRVLFELQRRLSDCSSVNERHQLIDIQLNLAKPLPPLDLMFHLIRCLFSRLRELELLAELPETIRQELILAYRRTSMTVMRGAMESREANFGLPDFEFDILSAGKGKLKSPLGFKRSKTSNHQQTFLAYDERAAEYDLIRLSSLLTSTVEKRLPWWIRWRGSAVRTIRMKIVFVFDELDKLDDTAGSTGARPYLDDLFGSLKNLFTTSGLTFVFVAGKETQDRWVEDIGRGDSVYESVFAYERYLPCVWGGARVLCDKLFASALEPDQSMGGGRSAGRKPACVVDLHRYLTYVGRGIPRRMLRTVNEFVRWIEKAPNIALTDEELTRVEFYSDLQRLLEENPSILGHNPYEAGVQRDKRQLAVYYILDWILRRSDRPFTLDEVLEAANSLSNKLVGALAMSEPVNRLVAALLDWSYLERVNSLDEAQILETTKPQVDRYRLTDEALIALSGIRRPEPASFAQEDSADQSAPNEGPAVGGEHLSTGSVVGGYQILSPLGRGGFGSVYRAIHIVTQRIVALKVRHADFPSQGSRSDDLFRREIDALRQMHNPSIVQVLDVGEWHGNPYCVMELIEGVNLRAAVGSSIAVPGFAVYVGIQMASAFGYVHSLGFFRNDIKPENIMLSTSGMVYLFDFGTVVRPDSFDSVLIGTPGYMAPEAFEGVRPDPRMDVYAVGLVLYELACGRRPFGELLPLPELIRKRRESTPIPPSEFVQIPRKLEDILMKCLEPKPENRYGAMAELASDLKDCSEDFDVRVTAAAVTDWVRTNQVRREAGQAANRVVTANEFSGFVGRTPLSMIIPDDFKPDTHTIFPTVDSVLFLPTAKKPVPYVIVYGPDWPEGRRRFNLLHPEVRVGRGSDAEIRLEDRSVSRIQAKILLREGRYHFFDFGSRNGALVNGTPVDRKVLYPLEDGTEVRFDPYRIVFHAEPEPAVGPLG